MSEINKNETLNELLGEVVHMASQAMMTDDVHVKRAAMGDIVDALASVIPCEHAAASSRPPYQIAAASPFAAAKRTKIRAINGHLNVVAKADVIGRKFFAEADWEVENNKTFHEGFVGIVSEKDTDNSWIMARIEFNPNVGGNACKSMLRGILLGISHHYGHNRRKRANKRARLAAQKEA